MPGPQRARPAGPEQADPRSSARSAAKLPFLATSYLEIAHWSILLRGIEGDGEALDEMAVYFKDMRFALGPLWILAAISSLKSSH